MCSLGSNLFHATPGVSFQLEGFEKKLLDNFSKKAPIGRACTVKGIKEPSLLLGGIFLEVFDLVISRKPSILGQSFESVQELEEVVFVTMPGWRGLCSTRVRHSCPSFSRLRHWKRGG